MSTNTESSSTHSDIDKFREKVEALLKPSKHEVYQKLSHDLYSDEDLIKKIQHTLSTWEVNDNNTLQELKNQLEKAINSVQDPGQNPGVKTNKIGQIQENIKEVFEVYKEKSGYDKEIEIETEIEKIFRVHNEKWEYIKCVISRDSTALQEALSSLKEENPPMAKIALDKRCACLEGIVKDLWIHLALSILKGEILEDPRYSSKLNKIAQSIKTGYTDEAESVQYLHPILARIHALCQELSFVCQLIRIQIECPYGLSNTAHKRHVIHAPVFDLKNMPYAGGVYSREKLQSDRFYDLASLLITMTKVDICGVINSAAITSLFLLYKHCAQLIGNGERENADNFEAFFPWDTSIREIFLLIQAKTSLLLIQSFYKPHINESDGILHFEESTSTPYSRVVNFEVLYEGEKYSIDDRSSSASLFKKCFTEFKKLRRIHVEREHNTETDITAYDSFVTRGKERLKNLPPIEKEKLLSCINEKSGTYPISTLLSLMKSLKDDYSKMSESDKKSLSGNYAKAMEILLKHFAEQIQQNKEYVDGSQKKDLYKDSFFQLDGCDLKIFISSYGCCLYATEALEQEAYHHYNREYRKWLSNAQITAMSVAETASNKAETASNKAETASNKAETASNKAETASNEAKTASNEAKNTFNKMQQMAFDSRKEAISTLAIFAALVSFISGGISILNGVSSLPDYMILAGTLYIFIASIIGFLYFKTIEHTQLKQDCQEEQDSRTGKRAKCGGCPPTRLALILSIAFALLVIICGFYLRTQVSDGSKRAEIEEGTYSKRTSSADHHAEAKYFKPQIVIEPNKRTQQAPTINPIWQKQN